MRKLLIKSLFLSAAVVAAASTMGGLVAPSLVLFGAAQAELPACEAPADGGDIYRADCYLTAPAFHYAYPNNDLDDPGEYYFRFIQGSVQNTATPADGPAQFTVQMLPPTFSSADRLTRSVYIELNTVTFGNDVVLRLFGDFGKDSKIFVKNCVFTSSPANQQATGGNKYAVWFDIPEQAQQVTPAGVYIEVAENTITYDAYHLESSAVFSFIGHVNRGEGVTRNYAFDDSQLLLTDNIVEVRCSRSATTPCQTDVFWLASMRVGANSNVWVTGNQISRSVAGSCTSTNCGMSVNGVVLYPHLFGNGATGTIFIEENNFMGVPTNTAVVSTKYPTPNLGYMVTTHTYSGTRFAVGGGTVQIRSNTIGAGVVNYIPIGLIFPVKESGVGSWESASINIIVDSNTFGQYPSGKDNFVENFAPGKPSQFVMSSNTFPAIATTLVEFRGTTYFPEYSDFHFAKNTIRNIKSLIKVTTGGVTTTDPFFTPQSVPLFCENSLTGAASGIVDGDADTLRGYMQSFADDPKNIFYDYSCGCSGSGHSTSNPCPFQRWCSSFTFNSRQISPLCPASENDRNSYAFAPLVSNLGFQ